MAESPHPTTQYKPHRSPPTPTQLAAWLEVLADGYEVVHVFVKGLKVPGLQALVNKVGYYDVNHFADLARHVLRLSGSATAIYFGINPIKGACLARAKNRLELASRAPRTTGCDVVSRRTLLIDIDPRTEVSGVSATEKEKRRAARTSLEIIRGLKAMGWPDPVVVDSGNGFQLHYRVDLPADDGGLVMRCLQALDHLFSDESGKVDPVVHDANRLAKLPGTMACKGDPLPERPHRLSRVQWVPPEGRKPVPRRLLEELAARMPSTAVKQGDSVPAAVLDQARAYMAELAPAVSGQGGHAATFRAACKLVIGFGLSPEQAFPLLAEYNKRCKPPWTDDELRHKLGSANEEPGPRGQLRHDHTETDDPYAGWQPLQGPEFIGYVPDFGYADRERVLLELGQGSPKSLLRYYADLFVACQLSNAGAYSTDVWLRQLLWGGVPPQNWKPLLRKQLSLPKTLENVEAEYTWEDCNKWTCLLAQQQIRHEHFPALSKDSELFHLRSSIRECEESKRESGQYQDPAAHRHWTREFTKRIKEANAFLAYWPALLFGCSPRVGWTESQQRCVQGIVYELTRAKGKKQKTGRGLKLEPLVICDRRIVSGTYSLRCPFLEPDRQYVVFGGNGNRLRGHGYKIVGRTKKGWLRRVGYEPSMQSLASVQQFLQDLKRLSDDLDLVVAAYSSTTRQWKNLNELIDCFRKKVPDDKWLRNYSLRIFAPSDWLIRWRHFFAKRMGFRWIPVSYDDPGPMNEEEVRTRSGDMIATGSELRQWLKEMKWSQQELAAQLGCSRRRVSCHTAGRSSTSKFFDELAELRRRLGQ